MYLGNLEQMGARGIRLQGTAAHLFGLGRRKAVAIAYLDGMVCQVENACLADPSLVVLVLRCQKLGMQALLLRREG